jgi:NADPH-dependent 2,4-dienoyl-CoA reductase/sulfur reductase-like enzyme
MRHVVIVGAGPAGLAAASAALRAGAEVTLLDAADQAGGQYHRMPPDAYEATRPFGGTLGRCDWWPESAVWALEPREGGPPRVHVLRGPVDGNERRRQVLEPDALVLAPGAHDRVLPFPGWELPGVVTAGAAQALAKGERLAVGRRVVVGGAGPFLLPVAVSLLRVGARVVEADEANPAGTVLRGWASRPWRPAGRGAKMPELAAYAATLARHRVPYRTGRAIVEVRGDGRVEEAVTARLRADWSVVAGTERSVAVDAVCVSHGFGPQLELPVAAGCALRDGFVAVDDDQATSGPGVYAAGEVTGIAGAPAARAEGTIAGWAAANGQGTAGARDTAGGAAPGLESVRRRRDQGRVFAERLAAAHPIGAAWSGWLRPGTVVCRCEETTYETLCRAMADPAYGSAQALKLATRAGLGPCQARVCGPTVAELTGRNAHHRPIAWPIRLGELAAPPAGDAPSGDARSGNDPAGDDPAGDDKESTP